MPERPDPSDPSRLSRRSFLTGAAGMVAAGSALRAQALSKGVQLVAHRAATATGPSAICDAIGHQVAERIWRGYRSDRSGHLIVVPHGFNYMSGGISHSTPWPYTQDVPMQWYGPGVIPARGAQKRWVTHADIAPTLAKLAGFAGFDAPDGFAMKEILTTPPKRPRLVVVMVWDGGGQYVLDLWPKAWPFLRSIRSKGVWYSHATCGSSPTNTAPTHATIGTGAFPRRHGIVDSTQRFADGGLHDAWSKGPSQLLLPTFVDRYLEAKGGEPRVGMLGTLTWHLGMLGHGSYGAFSHKPFAVLRDQRSDTGAWQLAKSVADYYEFPSYVNDLPALKTYWEVADLADGKNDGTWRGHDISKEQGGFHTPARIPYQTRMWQEVIRREGFGSTEGRTDVLFLNAKIIDEVGHLYSASSPEMRDTIAVQDRYLGRFCSFLDEQVGKGNWALCLTADHGHTAAPSVSGGYPISEHSVLHLVQDRFDRDGDRVAMIRQVRPVWMYLNEGELLQQGVTPRQIAAYVRQLTKAQTSTIPVPLSQRGDEVFATAFPASALSELPCV